MTIIEKIRLGSLQLPTISRVVLQVMKSLRDEDFNILHVAALLKQDPVLSARLLRLSNSAYFKGSKQLLSIDDAVIHVGLHALGNLVLCCGVAGAFSNVKGIDLRMFWQESLTAAQVGHFLALESSQDPDVAYAANLLHGVGSLVMLSLPETEWAPFDGVTAKAGAAWLEYLKFPHSIVSAVERQEMPVQTSDSLLQALVSVASSIAKLHYRGIENEEIPDALDKVALSLLGLEKSAVSALINEQMSAWTSTPSVN